MACRCFLFGFLAQHPEDWGTATGLAWRRAGAAASSTVTLDRDGQGVRMGLVVISGLQINRYVEAVARYSSAPSGRPVLVAGRHRVLDSRTAASGVA